MRNQRPIVSFTFDDAPRSAYTLGAAILESAGGCGTFYVCGELCDTSENGLDFLKSIDLNDLNNRGHELGCHTFSHVRIPLLSTRDTVAQFSKNQDFVERVCGDVMLSNFSYPFGDVSPTSRLAAQGRFSSCRGITAGVNSGFADLGLLKAVSIYDRDFNWEAIGRFLDEAQRANGWLIFYTHDIGQNPSPFGTSPRIFEQLVKRVGELGFMILTVRNAVGAVGFRNSDDIPLVETAPP